MEFIDNKIIDKLLIPNENYFIASWSYNGDFTCQESFENLTGFTKEEISSFPYKHHSLTENGEDEQIYNSVIQLNFDEKISQITKIFKIISKAEKPIWLKEFISIDESNINNGFFSLLVDITDLKQREVEFHKIIETKTEQNNSKDKLISIISQDRKSVV